jgi:hypothetical protein
MAFETGRIQIDGSLNVDGSIYQYNQLFSPGGGGTGDVAWASGNLGDEYQLITANGDGSIVAESNLTFDGTTLKIDGSLSVEFAGDKYFMVNNGGGTNIFDIKIGDIDEVVDGNFLNIKQNGDIVYYTELTQSRFGFNFTNNNFYISSDTDLSINGGIYANFASIPDGTGTADSSILFIDSATGQIKRTVASGGGVSWNGSTANAIGTYGSSSTIDAEPNLTFDGNILEFDSAADKTIRMKDIATIDSTPQSLSILGAKGFGATYSTTQIGPYTYQSFSVGFDGGDVKVQAGQGADPNSFYPALDRGGIGGDLLLYGGAAGDPNGTKGNVVLDGHIVQLNSNAVDIPFRLRHAGDENTYLEFTPDVIKLAAGVGLNAYEQQTIYSGGVVFNEDSQDYDFRVESADNPMMFNIISQTSTPYVQINAYDTGTTPPTRTGPAGTVLELHETNAYLLIANRSGNGETGIHMVDYGSYTTQTGRIAYDCTSYNMNFYLRGGSTTEVAAGRFDYVSTSRVDLLVNGDVVAYSSAFSDKRLKENINLIESPLDIIKQLRGITYNKIGEEENHIGYIAQEVEEFLPNIITEKDMLGKEVGDKYKGIRYTEIIPIITEAMKEQQSIIEKQEQRIKDLEEKVELLLKHLG